MHNLNQALEIESQWRTGCNPNIARDLYRLDKETLTWLITQLPNASLQTCGSSEVSMVSHITSIEPEHWAKTHPWLGKSIEVVSIQHCLFIASFFLRCLIKKFGWVR